MPDPNEHWLALAIGNSRLHWAWFQGAALQQTWDTAHLQESLVNQLIASGFSFLEDALKSGSIHSQSVISNNDLSKFPRFSFSSSPTLYLASVVPSQSALWNTYSNLCSISLQEIPLKNLYPTFGIDRALTLLGAIATQPTNTPTLVIDAGTALTFTAADASRQLIGGAILPGISLQARSLTQNTALLPQLTFSPEPPIRWATNTPDAIRSGIFYTVLAGVQDFITDWLKTYPSGAIALTGGDAPLLQNALLERMAAIAPQLRHDPTLIFQGILSVRDLPKE